MRVPNFERGHSRVLAHVLSVRLSGAPHRMRAMAFSEAGLAHGKDNACRQALDVPFPGRGKRLVEIIDVEDQLPFGSSKTSKICNVAISAGLHTDFSDRRV